MEPIARIEIIVHAGPQLPQSAAAIEAAHHAESGLSPSPVVVQATDGYDRAQLLAALQAAHERDHRLVEQAKQANDLLRERTIERDHYREDSLLWGLVVAWYVDSTEGGELVVQKRDVDAYQGKMVSGEVSEDGWLTISVSDRPERSDEAPSG